VSDETAKAVRVLRRDALTLAESKDEEYAYWQSRSPLDRLVAMQKLSFAFFEGSDNAAETDSNFCDLLAAFQNHEVRYLLIGGWAVSIHAQPRATQHMDVFVSGDKGNVEAVYNALLEFGAPMAGLNEKEFLKPDTFFRVGAPPCQIDILPGIPGVEFDRAWPNRLKMLVDEQRGLFVDVISAEDLVASKIASGRKQDLADVEAIRRAQKGRNDSR
jgi:hypothetical protein